MVQDGSTILTHFPTFAVKSAAVTRRIHARLAALVDVPRLALAWRAFLADRTEADFRA